MSTIDEFRSDYVQREPRIKPTDLQKVKIGAQHGVRQLDGQDDNRYTTVIPLSDSKFEIGLCLWVIATRDAPYSIEACSFASDLGLKNGVIKHTNLTGGENAHCGGELWFVGERRILINGFSGRYGPRKPKELMDAAAALQGCGYEVGVVSWDDELLECPRLKDGLEDIKWL